MSKELENLLEDFKIIKFKTINAGYDYGYKVWDKIEQALTELKAIKEAKPNDALDSLEDIGYAPLNECCGYPYTRISDEYDEDFNIIKQYILKAQYQENEAEKYKKALDIVIRKEVHTRHFSEEIKQFGKKFTYEFYLLEFHNYHYFVKEENKLTKEEFELLKRCFECYILN